MKKFYFLLVAMLVGFAANADWYLVGGFNSWNNGDANYKFTDKGDGTFELKVDVVKSDFKVTQGDWTDSKNFASNGSELVPGTPYTLGAGGAGNIQIQGGQVNNATITLNPTAKTLLIVGEEVEVTYSYGIWGCLASGTWAATDLTEKDGKWVAENVQVTYASAEFGIKKLNGNDQAAWISSPTALKISEAGNYTMKVDGGNNVKIATGTYGFSFDPETMVLTVTGEGGDDPIVEIDFTGWYFNVPFAPNYSDNGVLFNEDGTAVQNNLPLGGVEFEIKVWNGSQALYYSFGGEIEAGVEYEVGDRAGVKTTIKGSAAGQLYDVFFDYNTSMLKVELVGGGDDPVEVPEALYIIGDIKDAQWNTANGVELTKEGNVFKAEDVVFEAVDPTANCYFSFTSALGADWDELNSNADRFGAEVNGTQIVLGTAAEMVVYKNNVNASACNAWQVVPGTYDVTVDFENMMVTLAGTPSGVDAIAVDANNVAPVYYNLQGVQVNEPAAGLYIVRRGDKVAKEIVR